MRTAFRTLVQRAARAPPAVFSRRAPPQVRQNAPPPAAARRASSSFPPAHHPPPNEPPARRLALFHKRLRGIDKKRNADERAEFKGEIVAAVLADPAYRVGLVRFLARVYARMGWSVGATAALGLAAHVLVGPAAIAAAALPIAGTALLGAFGGLYVLFREKPTYTTRVDAAGNVLLEAAPSWARESAFRVIVVAMGASAAPLVSLVADSAPSVLPVSLLASTLVFGTAAFFVTRYGVRGGAAGDAAVMRWGAPLAGGLAALVVTQLLGLGAALALGPNSFSALVHSVDMFGGIALFTALSGYDAYVCVRKYALGKPDEIALSLTIYLDFINLWVRIMSLMAARKK